MGAEVKSYITQKLTEANKKRYGDEKRFRRYVKEKSTGHLGYEEEEYKDPAKKPKLEKGGRNENNFGRVKNGRFI